MMDNLPSATYLLFSGFCFALSIVAIGLAVLQAYAMRKDIQGSVFRCYGWAPVLAIGVLVSLSLVWGKGAMYGVQQWEKGKFLNIAGAEKAGYLGKPFLAKKLCPDTLWCGDIRRLDGKPIGPSLKASHDPPVLCGITHEEWKNQNLFPFVKIGEEMRVMVGAWPASYQILLPAE